MYIISYTYYMNKKPLPPLDSPQQFFQQLQRLWPAIKGSLARVRKPCIRAHCPTCASGRQHPADILSFTEKGRRRCMYVPEAMVPALRQALRNGRRVETLLYRLGVAMLLEYRHQRKAISKK